MKGHRGRRYGGLELECVGCEEVGNVAGGVVDEKGVEGPLDGMASCVCILSVGRMDQQVL